MAIISLSYCNASLEKPIQVDYDNVAHTIVGYSIIEFEGPCFPGLVSGAILHSHDDGGFNYSVRVQNSAPYAYVLAVSLCSVSFTSATPSNSATDESNDGTITVVASGNGTLAYSINNGQSWQSSNLFTGLAPGTYQVLVRNTYFGEYCYASSGPIVVGFNTLACDLAMGNIVTTEAPGGTITVQTMITTKPYALEYRLDAGAWQDSPVFTGLSAGTYNVQARFKAYTDCSANRNVEVTEAPETECTLVLQGVQVVHESAKYADDGAIAIYATTQNGPISYSIDNGLNYQAGNEFNGLQPGVYTVRVKDAVEGCDRVQTVEIYKYKAPFAEFPIAQPHRVVLQSGPFVTVGARQNMDNTLFGAMKWLNRWPQCYWQQWKNTQATTIQWRSSYRTHTVKIYNEANVLQSTIIPAKKTGYLNKPDSRTANFSDAGANQTQVWFPGGMPNIYEIGQDITVTDNAEVNGEYEIVDIRVGTGEAEGHLVLVIDHTYTAMTDPITATVATVYDVEPWDVWEVTIDWSELGAGKYYITFNGTDNQFDSFSARSEPVEIVSDDSKLLSLSYFNMENAFKIEYSTGITFTLRVEGELLPDKPGGEREVMEDSRRRPITLREYVTRNMNLVVEGVPPYIGEKIRLALAHDYVVIDGKEFQKADDVNIEFPDVHDVMCNVTCRLREANFMAENAHDSGDVDATLLELGDNEIMEVEP
jgi:hypothetical protein